MNQNKAIINIKKLFPFINLRFHVPFVDCHFYGWVDELVNYFSLVTCLTHCGNAWLVVCDVNLILEVDSEFQV